MKKVWNLSYKILGIVLVGFALTYGLFVQMPYNPIWGQSSRNLFYHVPMWFSEITLMTISVVWSITMLVRLDPDRKKMDYSGKPTIGMIDAKARIAAEIGVLLNSVGLITGIIWSRVTWGENLPDNDFSAWWVWDPIQVCALISLLIYLGYFLLRSSFSEPEQRGRIAAVYNIFAFATLIPLFFIVPKMLPGLHPTAEQGSQILARKYDGNSYVIMLVGIVGFSLLGTWMWEVRSRLAVVKERLDQYISDKTYEKQLQN
ncbi:MAG: cytochrome c biogenesis protein [Bacteroidia bacterium]|nr:cytochrome c biogenesis protein [Bacteroidia bacterium]